MDDDTEMLDFVHVDQLTPLAKSIFAAKEITFIGANGSFSLDPPRGRADDGAPAVRDWLARNGFVAKMKGYSDTYTLTAAPPEGVPPAAYFLTIWPRFSSLFHQNQTQAF